MRRRPRHTATSPRPCPSTSPGCSRSALPAPILLCRRRLPSTAPRPAPRPARGRQRLHAGRSRAAPSQDGPGRPGLGAEGGWVGCQAREAAAPPRCRAAARRSPRIATRPPPPAPSAPESLRRRRRRRRRPSEPRTPPGPASASECGPGRPPGAESPPPLSAGPRGHPAAMPRLRRPRAPHRAPGRARGCGSGASTGWRTSTGWRSGSPAVAVTRPRTAGPPPGRAGP